MEGWRLILEGGYHIQGLTHSVKAVLYEMNDETGKTEGELAEAARAANPAIERVIKMVGPAGAFLEIAKN